MQRRISRQAGVPSDDVWRCVTCGGATQQYYYTHATRTLAIGLRHVLDVHAKEDVLLAYAAVCGPVFEHGEFEADPAKGFGEFLDFFFVGGAVYADDELAAVEVLAAGEFEQGHESRNSISMCTVDEAQ